MKNKAKKLAVSAEIRNESNKLDGLHEYTITIKNENGESGQTRAFGKDLQDALSKVNHDLKVEVIKDKVINKLPDVTIPLVWIGLLAVIVSTVMILSDENTKPLYVIASMWLYVLTTFVVNNWFNLKNIKK